MTMVYDIGRTPDRPLSASSDPYKVGQAWPFPLVMHGAHAPGAASRVNMHLARSTETRSNFGGRGFLIGSAVRWISVTFGCISTKVDADTEGISMWEQVSILVPLFRGILQVLDS